MGVISTDEASPLSNQVSISNDKCKYGQHHSLKMDELMKRKDNIWGITVKLIAIMFEINSDKYRK